MFFSAMTVSAWYTVASGSAAKTALPFTLRISPTVFMRAPPRELRPSAHWRSINCASADPAPHLACILDRTPLPRAGRVADPWPPRIAGCPSTLMVIHVGERLQQQGTDVVSG